jgi:hypothetical protein
MDYRSNEAWQACDDLAVAVYQATEAYPSYEQYGLISQTGRAAVSAEAQASLSAKQAKAARILQGLINHWERQLKAGRTQLDLPSPQPPAPRS